MSEIESEPACPTDVLFIMQYGLYEKGKKYTAEEALALYRKGRDAGLKKDCSREDEEELADVTADMSRWEIARDTRDLEGSLKQLENSYREDFRKMYSESSQNEEERILSAYAHIVQQYRSLEWSAVYDNREVSPIIKLKLVEAEAELKEALKSFESRYHLYEPYGKPKAEILKDATGDLGSVTEHRATLEGMRNEHAEEQRRREEKANKAQGCGCLVLIVPAFIFFGSAVIVGISRIA
jgi:hypothetical protein